ncbi:DUF4174 domain-containing protein [Mangrovivirga sp. M17]|uniref:DUF4174 domain-containing protein n=1 Tax=Mangrovivirga halotolerans TaxID=2993936 RepID=A0ABT3RRI4_9BACT|nr:DUF4174 domain-containing protein [Mangrovivirga halotolerans]MCX2744225.1 DUF4174 domain-containing protein [Mangrovivirga halotolerans]
MKQYFVLYYIVIVIALTSMSTFNNLNKILEDAAWQKRVLIISSSSDKHSLIREQYTKWKKDLPGLIDRDLIIIAPEEAKWMIISNQADIETHFVPNKKLIHKFELDSSKLNIILIGKDTGVKDITHQIRESKYWFDKIDQMPMRKTEMKKN